MGKAQAAIERRDRAAGEVGGKRHLQRLALREMHRDVAAIIDEGAVERGGLHHHAEDLIGHRPRHRRHRRDEDTGMGPAGRHHPLRHRAFHLRLLGHGLAQFGELADELRQHRLEA